MQVHPACRKHQKQCCSTHPCRGAFYVASEDVPTCCHCLAATQAPPKLLLRAWHQHLSSCAFCHPFATATLKSSKMSVDIYHIPCTPQHAQSPSNKLRNNTIDSHIWTKKYISPILTMLFFCTVPKHCITCTLFVCRGANHQYPPTSTTINAAGTISTLHGPSLLLASNTRNSLKHNCARIPQNTEFIQ